MNHREHPLAEVVLGRHKDALAVEETGVHAPGCVEAPLLVLVQATGGLLVGRCSRPDVIEDAKGRPRDGVELGDGVGAGFTVAVREGVYRGIDAA